jgi:hypothetical protein
VLVSELDPSRASPGEVLDPMVAESRDTFPGWDAALAPWGCFALPSGLSIVDDEGLRVLEWSGGMERALITGDHDWRECSALASIKPMDVDASPNSDRNDWEEALAGIVFRMKTSRFYYQFGLEGCRRAVLYRRADDEWFEMASKEVSIPEGYVDLEVKLDGDGIRCSCQQLGVRFFVTDTTFESGRVGMRAMGRARCSRMAVWMTPPQRQEFERRKIASARRRALLGGGIPDPKLVREFDLAEIGGDIQFLDFTRPDAHDMLVTGEGFTRGMTIEGEVLWEADERLSGVVASSEADEGGRLLYAFAGVRRAQDMKSVVGDALSAGIPEEVCVIRGDTGEVKARCQVPSMDDDIRRVTLTTHTGRLAGKRATDIILREWSAKYGHGGVNLWAYDCDLDPLWESRVETPYGHGHALQFFDIDGDGRDEVLVGGTMFSPGGEVLWTHDRADEMARISGAQHYDAVAIGNTSGDPSLDPVAFLLGGSAGVYVVDGLSGETRMVHRVGHAQGRFSGNVRKDLPGTELLVACRWGNMGILTLFSGRGDRLWSIQPDYLGQGSCPVSWGSGDEQLIWSNTTAGAQAFYDGNGRLVKDLPEIRDAYGTRMRKDVATSVVRMGEDPRDLLAVRAAGRLRVYGPGAD